MANTTGMRNEGVEQEQGRLELSESQAKTGALLLEMVLLMETMGHVSIRATQADLPCLILLGEVLQADMVEVTGGIATFIRL